MEFFAALQYDITNHPLYIIMFCLGVWGIKRAIYRTRPNHLATICDYVEEHGAHKSKGLYKDFCEGNLTPELPCGTPLDEKHNPHRYRLEGVSKTCAGSY